MDFENKDLFPNYSIEELVYNLKCTGSLEATVKNAAGNRIGKVPYSQNGTYPTLISFGHDPGRKVIQFRIAGIQSNWSQDINVSVPNEGSVIIQNKNGNISTPFSVSISQKGDKKKGSHTKFVYILPYYRLINCLDFPIELSDSWTNPGESPIVLPKDSKNYVYFQKFGQDSEDNKFKIRAQKDIYWSREFYFSEFGEFHARLIRANAEDEFVDVNIFFERGRQCIVFKKGDPPFKIKNNTKVSFHIFLKNK
jgi:hypothetical protein